MGPCKGLLDMIMKGSVHLKNNFILMPVLSSSCLSFFFFFLFFIKVVFTHTIEMLLLTKINY